MNGFIVDVDDECRKKSNAMDNDDDMTMDYG